MVLLVLSISEPAKVSEFHVACVITLSNISQTLICQCIGNCSLTIFFFITIIAHFVFPFQIVSGSGKNKWVIFHQGGGWCGSLMDCEGRSKTDLGSSKNYPATSDLTAASRILSNDANANPLMYNWNAYVNTQETPSSPIGERTC
jgi:hypothetical protein